MAEGGLKGSRSAEELEKPKKPGKLSADLLNKFVSDPALTQPQPLQVNRLSALSFSSSSGEITTSQENVKSKKAEHVRIKEPGENDEQLCPSSADEDMLSDDEAGKETKTKKRALKWKWSPFKKMRRLFRRKKSPRRVKSCEELPIEQYKPTYVQTSAEDDDTLRNRTKSEPSLTEAKKKTPLAEVYETGPTADNLVYRTQSDPSSKVADKLLKDLSNIQDNSQDGISEVPAVSSESLHSSSTALEWSLISSYSGAEAAVSFENLPSASSLEGLQAAHDKIKVKPKHRRPPTRLQNKSKSMNLKKNPAKPHRRSKTDPTDLTDEDGVNTEQGSASTRNSHVISGTIPEDQECSDEQSKESVVADLKAKANDILSNLNESPKMRSHVIVNGTSEKEGQLVGEQHVGEKTKQGTMSESTVDMEQVKPNETDEMNKTFTDKENKATESKQNQQVKSVEGHVKAAEDKVLKELNVKKEVRRPQLDISRKSESLQIFEVKGKSEETNPKGKPPLRKGVSLDSSESKEKMNTNLKLKNVLEQEKQSANVTIEQKTSRLQIATEKLNDLMESKGSLPEKVQPPSVEKVVNSSRKGKPPLRQGVSLDSSESKEKMNTNLKLKNVLEQEKQSANVTLEQKTSGLQNATEKENNVMASKGSLPEKVQPPSGEKVVKRTHNRDESSGQPSWIELANKRSQRLSQLIEEDSKDDNKALLKVVTGAPSPPTSAASTKDSSKDDKPVPQIKEKPKVPTKPQGLSPKVTSPRPRPLSKTFNSTEEKKAPDLKPHSQDKPTVHAQIDKCAVCGTRVYQMEKCNFDSSVLHKKCIKCSVCKRLLTVGNFVIAESKVYCKPHAKTLTVCS